MKKEHGMWKELRPVLLGMILCLVFSGCATEKADKNVQDMFCEINPAAGVSAEGFVGIGGPSPVPADVTCQGGVVCCRPGASCGLPNPNREYQSTYDHQSRQCGCRCFVK